MSRAEPPVEMTHDGDGGRLIYVINTGLSDYASCTQSALKKIVVVERDE